MELSFELIVLGLANGLQKLYEYSLQTPLYIT